MIILICFIIDILEGRKWAKDRNIPKAHKKPTRKSGEYHCSKPNSPRAGYKVDLSIPYRGKYNDIY